MARVFGAKTPLLGKGGVAAPIKKKRRSLLSGRRRGGSFQPPIYRKLNEPPRPRFSKERGRLLDGAATPPLPRRGVPFGCFAAFQVHCVFTNPLVFVLRRRTQFVFSVLFVLSTTTWPAFITQRTFSLLETAVMLASGSPSTATMSA